MIERLEIIKKRYEELNAQLLDPENLSNIKLSVSFTLTHKFSNFSM